MAYQTRVLEFNSSPSTILHIDLNSCFATVEQQANPFLRGRPIAVAAYDSPGGCILAPSIEAKTYGIKTGMRVREGKSLYPGLIVLTPDPNKYRDVHLKFRKIFKDYTADFYPKSIDEFVLQLKDYPIFKKGMFSVGRQIKKRIKKEIGDWLTVSVGIAPNRFLAKTASGLNKPDGLNEINSKNFLEVYSKLTLTGLHGINVRNERRLNSVGVASVLDFYYAPLSKIRAAFRSVFAHYWYLRLRGLEVDSIEFRRRSFGNSYALPNHSGKKKDLLPILYNLVEKTAERMRKNGYQAKGVHVSLSFKNALPWNKRENLSRVLFDTRDIYQEMARILLSCPVEGPVHVLAERCFNLTKGRVLQLNAFIDMEKKQKLVDAVDTINNKWGHESVTYASLLKLEGRIHDRISFGGVSGLKV